MIKRNIKLNRFRNLFTIVSAKYLQRQLCRNYILILMYCDNKKILHLLCIPPFTAGSMEITLHIFNITFYSSNIFAWFANSSQRVAADDPVYVASVSVPSSYS